MEPAVPRASSAADPSAEAGDGLLSSSSSSPSSSSSSSSSRSSSASSSSREHPAVNAESDSLAVAQAEPDGDVPKAGLARHLQPHPDVGKNRMTAVYAEQCEQGNEGEAQEPTKIIGWEAGCNCPWHKQELKACRLSRRNNGRTKGRVRGAEATFQMLEMWLSLGPSAPSQAAHAAKWQEVESAFSTGTLPVCVTPVRDWGKHTARDEQLAQGSLHKRRRVAMAQT